MEEKGWVPKLREKKLNKPKDEPTHLMSYNKNGNSQGLD